MLEVNFHMKKVNCKVNLQSFSGPVKGGQRLETAGLWLVGWHWHLGSISASGANTIKKKNISAMHARLYPGGVVDGKKSECGCGSQAFEHEDL